MKILLINKYLYPKGGSETYMFQLSSLLRSRGHEVDFWGMSGKKNIVADKYGCFARNIDYNKIGAFGKTRLLWNTIYSKENQNKIAIVLDKFKPDLAHIHNYNFQLTPSILPIIKSRGIRIVQTVHDCQMVCPAHRFYNYQKQQICTKCIDGNFWHCIIDRCFDNSVFRSALGAFESFHYHSKDFYNTYLDAIISPSHFLASYIRKVMRMPIYIVPHFVVQKLVDRAQVSEDYILYIGRISAEKGILDIQDIFPKLKRKLVIVGDGPNKNRILHSSYIEYVGPKYGIELMRYTVNASFVIQPARWFENLPMVVIESFMCGTPVIAANKGGFLEMINDGFNGYLIDFEAHDCRDRLSQILRAKYNDKLRENCHQTYLQRYTAEIHGPKIEKIYEEMLG